MKVCERCTENNNCAWQNHEDTICHDAPAFPMTNADRIRSMTDEELATWIYMNRWNDIESLLEWLRQEGE